MVGSSKQRDKYRTMSFRSSLASAAPTTHQRIISSRWKASTTTAVPATTVSSSQTAWLSVQSLMPMFCTANLQHAPAVYFIQPPLGLEEAPFLPTMVEFPSHFTPCAIPPLDPALARLPPMPLPLPPCPSQIASLDLPVAPMSPTLATYRFPPMQTSLLPQSTKNASSIPGDKLPPLGQKSLLLPPMPSILAPRRSSAGIAGQMPPAKVGIKGGKKKAKHACKLCCIFFTRAHDLKRHNTIHKTGKYHLTSPAKPI